MKQYQIFLAESFPTNSWRMWKRAQRANLLVKAKCDMCGTSEGKLNRHHIKSEGSEEIIILCSKCHNKLHAGRVR